MADLGVRTQPRNCVLTLLPPFMAKTCHSTFQTDLSWRNPALHERKADGRSWLESHRRVHSIHHSGNSEFAFASAEKNGAGLKFPNKQGISQEINLAGRERIKKNWTVSEDFCSHQHTRVTLAIVFTVTICPFLLSLNTSTYSIVCMPSQREGGWSVSFPVWAFTE